MATADDRRERASLSLTMIQGLALSKFLKILLAAGLQIPGIARFGLVLPKMMSVLDDCFF
jgi:hypothetical protein